MNIGVHISHCCKWHGCKYNDPNCPVENGQVEQEYLCEWCSELLKDEEYLTTRLQQLKEIKLFREAHRNGRV